MVKTTLLLLILLLVGGCQSEKPGQPRVDADYKGADMEKATFAAGCFWHVEAAFAQVEGVAATTVGYTGGHLDNPTYEDVCSDTTGHAEAVQVEFDPARVSYEKLLEVFWGIHNPTTVNRQGPDVGSQYRSAVFHHSEAQRQAAAAYKEKLQSQGKFDKPIVTEITEASAFWPAEEYHQQYFKKRGVNTCGFQPG